MAFETSAAPTSSSRSSRSPTARMRSRGTTDGRSSSPGAAPGDRVRARIVEDHGAFARAEVVDRIASGAAIVCRRVRGSARAAAARGSTSPTDAQLAAKATNVREALARIAGVRARRELPIIAAPREWHTATASGSTSTRERRVGLLAARARATSVEIETCLDRRAGALERPCRAARRSSATLETPIATVELASNGRGAVVAHLSASGAFHAGDAAAVGRLSREPPPSPACGSPVAAGSRNGAIPRSRSPPKAARRRCVQRVGTFTQVNAAANRLLVDRRPSSSSGAT